MNDEIKAKCYDDLKIVFEFQCDKIRTLKTHRVILIVIIAIISILIGTL